MSNMFLFLLRYIVLLGISTESSKTYFLFTLLTGPKNEEKFAIYIDLFDINLFSDFIY